jgi:Golgi SNAP receptor complex protein 1
MDFILRITHLSRSLSFPFSSPLLLFHAVPSTLFAFTLFHAFHSIPFLLYDPHLFGVGHTLLLDWTNLFISHYPIYRSTFLYEYQPQLAQILVAGGSSSTTNTSTSAASSAEQGNSATNNWKHAWDEQAVIQQDMQSLLANLQKLVGQDMPRAATTPHTTAIVQRYQTILQDLRSDMDKTAARIRQAKERQELLSGSAPASGGNGMNVQDPAMEHLLRERNHIHNSMRAADSVLGQADSIRSDLRTQGRSLRNTGSLLGQITTAVPGLNHLVEHIRRKRSRDDYIVAGVIASCILVTMWYVFG